MTKNLLSHLIIDKAASAYEILGGKLLSAKRRSKLNNTDFSIISNNCWGGHVYRHFGLSYSSPTIGMYFFADEYMYLLRDLKRNLFMPLSFIKVNESKYKAELERKGQINVPIGLLGDKIEIVFLHYNSEEDARSKWMRRCERVNFDNLIVKNSEMNLCRIDNLIEFDKLSYKKKLLLVSKHYPQLSDYVVVKRYAVNGEVTNDTTWYSSFISLIQLINK